jgi:hypothetical protein
MSNNNIITLNNIDYHFGSFVKSSETILLSGVDTDNRLSLLQFAAYGGIGIVDSIFAPFSKLSFTLNVPNNGVENQSNFIFKGNNRNQYSMIMARTDTHSVFPVNINTLSDVQKGTILSYNGIITNMVSIGQVKNGFSIQEIECGELIECLLKEKKIAQIIPAVDNAKTVSQNIADILKLVLPPDKVDDSSKNNSFSKCTERFTSPFVYPVDFTAYDAIEFLLPFCLGKVKEVDTQLFLQYNNISGKFILRSPLEDLLTFNVSERFNIGEQVGDLPELSDTISRSNGAYFAGNDINSYSFLDVGFNRSNTNYVNIKIINSSNPFQAGDLGYIKIEEEVNKFTSNILSNLQKNYTNGVKANIPLDSSKLGGDGALNYKVLKGPYERGQLERIARSQLNSLFVFENMTLFLTVPGQVYRTPGEFIEINRSTKGGEFDKKLLGHWYITEVKHIIDSKGVYMNQLLCTKPFIAI